MCEHNFSIDSIYNSELDIERTYPLSKSSELQQG